VSIQVLDTNYLHEIWYGRFPSPGDFGRVTSVRTAREAARRWLELFPSSAIVTPVRLEILAGVRDKDEKECTDAFLGEFRLLDRGIVLPDDWRLAEQLAPRVKKTNRKRKRGVPDPPRPGAMDCLILAICKRLNADLLSLDEGTR
jgi:predicted nucleic acid-binding protein